MTAKQKKTLKVLIDESYKLDYEIKSRQFRLDANKKEIKELTKNSKLKMHRGHTRKCIVFDKSYGYVEDNDKVWKSCKRDRKLFYSLVKAQVTKIEKAFEESVVKELVSYKKIRAISFKK